MPLALLGALVFAVDQLTKWAIARQIAPHESYPVLRPILSITHVQNPGAAFGLFAHQTPLFVGITLIILALAIIYRKRIAREPLPVRVGLALGLGGAMGNFADRVRTGYVVDFLELPFWPVFNIADVAIVVGVGLLIWNTLSADRRRAGRPESSGG